MAQILKLFMAYHFLEQSPSQYFTINIYAFIFTNQEIVFYKYKMDNGASKPEGVEAYCKRMC